MRSIFVVFSSPLFDLTLGLLERLEPVGIQAFSPEAGVEALDKCVLDGLSGPNKIQPDTILIGPLIEGLRGKLGPVVQSE